VAASHDDTAAAWQVDLQKRHEALVAANGPGTDAELSARLLAMVERDQDARGYKDGAPKDKTQLVMAGNLTEIDAALTT
jgi:hypothetical protein